MIRSFVICCFGLLLVASATAATREASFVDSTRSTLEKWVEARQLISQTRSDWASDKELLEQSIALFERQLEEAARQRAAVSTNSATVDQERAVALEQQASFRAATERVQVLVTSLEQRLQSLAPSLPGPLAEKMQPLLKRIPSDPATTKATAVERMQTVVGILNELDKFNAAITVASEIRKVASGEEVQVDTLYVGLAQGYYSDKEGAYAGVGVPAAAGWQWSPRPELSPAIRKALAMYRNAAPPGFVPLPVEIR